MQGTLRCHSHKTKYTFWIQLILRSLPMVFFTRKNAVFCKSQFFHLHFHLEEILFKRWLIARNNPQTPKKNNQRYYFVNWTKKQKSSGKIANCLKRIIDTYFRPKIFFKIGGEGTTSVLPASLYLLLKKNRNGIVVDTDLGMKLT